jgi:hypothetical protein
MLDAIGATLPLAFAIAFSPLAIVSVVVMLLSDHPRATSLGFLAGWFVGIGVITVAGYLLARLVPPRTDLAVAPLTLLIIGIAFIGLFVWQWRGRPGGEDEITLPSWMAKIEGLTALKSFIFGALFAAGKPKNLLLAIGAGVSVQAADVIGAEAVISLTIFLVIASLSILVPVLGWLVLGERVRQPLEQLREWMVRHNSAIVAVILLLVGVALIGSALTGFDN